jgi:3-oxoacyl-[acyl-carrier protein] reductase
MNGMHSALRESRASPIDSRSVQANYLQEDELSQNRFEGKTVVITGGGAGIGRAFANRFAHEGASIVVADFDASVGQRAAAEIESEHGPALFFQMDVRDVDRARRMAEGAVGRFGGIDILVNNAGIHLDHAQLPYTLDAVEDWRRVLDVNVIGALVCTAATRDAMAARGGGAVLNISSMAAYVGGSAYSVSKMALNSLTVGLAADLGASNIRVNGIAPGLVDSESAVAWWSSPGRQGIQESLIKDQMLKRAGTMEDIADMALFLCSEAASFVTGQTILVDGGHTKKPF